MKNNVYNTVSPLLYCPVTDIITDSLINERLGTDFLLLSVLKIP